MTQREDSPERKCERIWTLPTLSPYEAIHSCVDTGAAIARTKGVAEAEVHPSVGVIGDSPFIHSGLTGLVDIVEDKTPGTLIIADNVTTGMTDGQAVPAAGDLEEIMKGLGVDPAHVRVVVPLLGNHKVNVVLLRRGLGPSVIISRREYVVTARPARMN